MLNHVWLALIVIGILTAAGRDVYDLATNGYGNDMPWVVSDPVFAQARAGDRLAFRAGFDRAQLARHFPREQWTSDTVRLDARLTMHGERSGVIVLSLGDATPGIFRTMAEASGGQDVLTGFFRMTSPSGGTGELVLEPVTYVYLKKVTNAAFSMAGTAVEIALGLIGIMALWLGVMKVAEEAGLIRALARLVRPVTIRLFPDVPPEHPAIGAILMNISANMLGLGNAATPFGLKAMEELNAINPKAGVATNAMCTFLAMNTSCVTLIPATAIALRAAAGSSNPAIIIGTTFLASLTATICGVAVAKLLQRLKVFRFERAEAGA